MEEAMTDFFGAKWSEMEFGEEKKFKLRDNRPVTSDTVFNFLF
jgi:hypothetical protein